MHAAALLISAMLTISGSLAGRAADTLLLDLGREGPTTLPDEVPRPWVDEPQVGSGEGEFVSVPQELTAGIALPFAPVGSTPSAYVEPLASALPGVPDERLYLPVPQGAPGRPRHIVDSYEQALHRLSEEILELLEDSSVLLIWCFDRSESMGDDRANIRVLLERVYTELDQYKPISDYAVETLVTSFGARFYEETQRGPVRTKEEVLRAVSEIVSEKHGIERMCYAIREAIGRYERYARVQNRRMVLVLVTDESGERDDNYFYLERTVESARRAECRIYVFGREAVFGHHTAYVNWTNPHTNETRGLEISRGPESPGLEQLQTDGFGARSDAYASGFGPYGQCRLARETGGIFFLLPDEETNLARDESRRFQLEAVQNYLPFLGSRAEYQRMIRARPLPMAVVKIVETLDPYHPTKGEALTLRREFSPKLEDFLAEAAEAIQKAATLLALMEESLHYLNQCEATRDAEPELRWQANYDLLRGQLAAYVVRLRQYILTLEQFRRDPLDVQSRISPSKELTGWKLIRRRDTIRDPQTDEGIKSAKQLLEAVVAEHPATPWAARAAWELERGRFGFVVQPDYTRPAPGPGSSYIAPKL